MKTGEKWYENDINILAAMKMIRTHGPTRILCDDDAHRSPSRAGEIDRGVFDANGIVFIRNDGWSVGGHRSREKELYRLWKDEFVAFIVTNEFDGEPRPMSEYKPR